MKLSSFQKKIVDHIIAGDIYDIPSYLRVFGKGHDQQYDIKDIEKEFSIYEDGMTYIFIKKEDNSFYTEVYNKSGNLETSFPVANRHTIELYSNPITEPVSAQLEMIGPIEEVYYNDKKFQFDFLKNEYFVADSFSEIKDFVALWSYLRREALVFEGKKAVTDDDFSVFFELVDTKIIEDINPVWRANNELHENKDSEKMGTVTTKMVPKKKARNYIGKRWQFNQENFDMVTDYIGLKMMATSDLENYQQSKYRTVEERSQRNNLFVAWVAVAISVISVIIGNIVPLFQTSEKLYLYEINQQVSHIEQIIEKDDSSSKLKNISEHIDEIKESLKQDEFSKIAELLEEIIIKLNETDQHNDDN